MRTRGRGEGQVNWNKTRNMYIAVLTTHPVTGEKIHKTRTASVKGQTRAAYRNAEDTLDDLREELIAEAKAQVEQQTNYSLWQAITDWHAWVPTQRGTSQQTADRYLGQAKKWIRSRPALADCPLRLLDLETLGDFFDSIAGDLGADTLQDLKGTMKRSIDYAMRSKRRTGFGGPNLVNDVVLPEPGKQPREWDFLTQEQVEDALKAAEGTQTRALLMVGFTCGLRPGEIRALKWEHVRFDRERIYVVKWARKTGDGATKTSTSRRAVPMSPSLVKALQEHQEAYGDREYVFTTEDGRQLDKDALRWRFSVVMRAIGLPKIEDPYVMRHTFCSIMYHKGMKSKDIAALMGHSNEETFKKIYAHRLDPEGDLEEAADFVSSVWG